jgi:Leucine-rich repeat (LRR) protein
MARKSKKAASAAAPPRDEPPVESAPVGGSNVAPDDDFAADGEYPKTPTVRRAAFNDVSEETSESEEGWSDDSGRHSDNFENESAGSSTPKSRSTGPPVLPTRSDVDPDFDRFSPTDAKSHTPHPKPRSGGLMGGFFSRSGNANLGPEDKLDEDDNEDEDEDDEDEDDEPIQAIGGTYLNNNSTRSNRSSRSQSSNYSQDPQQFIAAPPLKRAISDDSVESVNSAEGFEPMSPVSPERYAPSPVNNGSPGVMSPRSEDPPESPANQRFGHTATESPMSSQHSRSSRRESFDDEPMPAPRHSNVDMSPRGTGIAYGDDDPYGVASPLSTSSKGRTLGGAYRVDDDLEDHPSRSGSVVDSVAFSEAEKRHRKTVTRLVISLTCALVCMAVMAGALVGIFVFGKGGNGGSAPSPSPPVTPSNSTDTGKDTGADTTSPPSISPATPTAAPSVVSATSGVPTGPITLPPSLANVTGNLTEITNQALFGMLAAFSVDDGVAMLTAGTPQSQAFSSVQAEDLGLDDARLAQRYALRTFYYSTNGATWTNNTGWEETTDECLWYSSSPSGMCTDSVLHTIEFINNNVTGVLPNELSMLTGMTKFTVTGVEGSTGLTDGIPDSMRTLSGMEEFVLQHHKMKGSVPSGMFDTWSAATTVSLVDCKIPGILPDVSGLKAAVDLNLSGNRFRGNFPESVTALTNLEVLTLASNKLKGPIPATGLEALTKLKYLSVADNSLTGTTPAQLGSIVSLSDGLDLSKNAFGGGIPTELNQLTALTRLLLSYNSYNGTVPDLSGLTQLKELALEGNELTGSVPDGTCTAGAKAEVSADCNPDGGGEVECPCCTKCCLSTADGKCQSAR